VRDLVVPTAHWPTAPVMTMEDVPTSSRSGFVLTFSEEITEPTIAELRAAIVAVEDEQTSAPTSTPEPVATEEELALEWLRENPNFQPQIGGARDRSVFSLRRTNHMPLSPANPTAVSSSSTGLRRRS
jgi:hypothetical protein